jgi:hypothetical protein
MPGKAADHRRLAASQSSQAKNKEEKLGKLLATHHGLKPGLANNFLLLFSAAAVFIPLGYGLWRSALGGEQHGPAAARAWSQPWFVLTLLAGTCFLLLAGYRFYRMRRYVAIFKNGIRLRLGLFRTRAWLWSEISGISCSAIQERFLHLAIRTDYKATLFTLKGRPIRLRGPLYDMPGLISRIKARLYPGLLTRLREAFQSGSRLSFGPLAIQSQGLSLGMKRKDQPIDIIPWEQVIRVDVQDGRLVIELQNQPIQSIPVGKIPNLELMLDLIHQGVAE